MNRSRAIVPLLLALTLIGCQQDKKDKDKPGFSPPPPKAPPRYPKSVPTPVDPALQAAANAEIKTALHSNDKLIRAHALETLAEEQMTDWSQQIVDALGDQSSLVRKSAALAAGQLQIKAAADHLSPLLGADAKADAQGATNATQERIAAIFALHRLGDTSHSHELEKTAFDTRPQVRGDTAFVFGLIGDKSAIPLLQQMLREDPDVIVRLEVAEALWRMGDQKGQEALVQATVSGYASDQMMAILALAEPHDTRMLEYIAGLFSNEYPEVQLMCARASGMLGSDIGYGIALKYADSADPHQRALAAMAFNTIGRSDSQKTLAKLLKDSDPDVRLAAAGALISVAEKH
jgi:HEAT repeat protein